MNNREESRQLTRKLQDFMADPAKSMDPELEQISRDVLLMSAAFEHANATGDPEDFKLWSDLFSRVRRDFYGYSGERV